jgi:uncharacterized membrane protein
MFANVWLVIWPNQRAVIENANRVAGGGAADPAAAGKGAQAGMASRTNALFSVPMLFFMAAGTHLPSITGEGGVGLYWILVLAIAAGLEWNGVFQKPGSSSQKMLTTVSGTIHAGLATAVVVAVLHLVVI